MKLYVRKNAISRTALATSLRITRQGLAQIFKSNVLKDETKRSIEKALKMKWADIAESVKNEQVDDNVSRETADYTKDYIELLKRENSDLRDKGISLTELDQRTKVVAQVQAAMMEMLLIQSQGQKGVYSKCVEILKKYELEHIFL